eukprot:4539830-Prymnesium_polylepis.2
MEVVEMAEVVMVVEAKAARKAEGGTSAARTAAETVEAEKEAVEAWRVAEAGRCSTVYTRIGQQRRCRWHRGGSDYHPRSTDLDCTRAVAARVVAARVVAAK